MDEWIYWAADRVEELARQDSAFLELLEKHDNLVGTFEMLLESLAPIEREIVLDYLNISTDLDYRRCQIAFELGRKTR